MEANPDFTSVTTEALETSITRLCADINAATYQQLLMIAEFDRRNGWGHEGCRSCAHWLNWRCGISLTAAREKVRVAHALANLPQTSKAFSAGVLSYSKARAITRVGTEHNEECLLSFARYGTASQLDKTVQLYRKQFDHAGEMMVGYHNAVFDDPTVVDQNTPLNQTDDQRRDAENQGALHHQEYRELNTRWDEHGCLEIKARLTPEQGAVVIKAIEAAVESIRKAEPTENSESHVHDTGNNTSAGAFSINTHQQHYRRRADALMLLAEAFLKDTKVAANTDDRYQVVVHVDSEVLSQNVFSKASGEPDCYIEQGVALPVETARRLSCSCKIVTALTRKSEPLNIGRSSRAISATIRRGLAIRDGECQFPGCDCRTHLDAHHIIHWANNGETSLDNLIEVCHHHHTLLHEGGYSVTKDTNKQLVFKRPDGQLIQQSITPEKSNPNYSASFTLPLSNNDVWSACGDTMDYSIAVYNIAFANRSASSAHGFDGQHPRYH